MTLAMLFTRTESASSADLLPLSFTPEFATGGGSSSYKLSASYNSASALPFANLIITSPSLGLHQAITKIVALEL